MRNPLSQTRQDSVPTSKSIEPENDMMRLSRTFILFCVALTTAVGCTPANPKPEEQAVIVHFTYGSTNLQPLFALEDKLGAAISQAKVGEYDGHEIAVDGSDGRFYMYGPDANKLFAVVSPILKSERFTQSAEVTKRFGPPNTHAREEMVTLSP